MWLLTVIGLHHYGWYTRGKRKRCGSITIRGYIATWCDNHVTWHMWNVLEWPSYHVTYVTFYCDYLTKSTLLNYFCRKLSNNGYSVQEGAKMEKFFRVIVIPRDICEIFYGNHYTTWHMWPLTVIGPHHYLDNKRSMVDTPEIKRKDVIQSQ